MTAASALNSLSAVNPQEEDHAMSAQTAPAADPAVVNDYCPHCDEQVVTPNVGGCPSCGTRLEPFPRTAYHAAPALAVVASPAAPARNSPAPERSLAQRMDALQRANEIRSARAQLKRDLKAGRTLIGDLLLSPPDYLETAKVFDLLLAVPKYGRVKVNKLLIQARISPSKTVGGMSERQRLELVTLIRTGGRW